MKIEIELPKELEKYKEDFIKYAMEAIEMKKADDDLKVDVSAVKNNAKKAVEDVKIDGKTWKKIKEEKKRMRATDLETLHNNL